MAVSTFSETQLQLDKGLSEQIAANFLENGINGAVFNQMTDGHLKELAPRIVDRITLKAIQDQSTAEKVRRIVSGLDLL